MQHTVVNDFADCLQALVQRDTGATLSAQGLAEVQALLQGRLAQSSMPVAEAGAHEVTLLLADLRGFAVLAATRPAQEVVAVLNRCLARLSAVVFRHQGTIEQFLGDSIRVVFADTPEQQDHVERALVCAVEMQLAMRDLNLEHNRLKKASERSARWMSP